MTRVHPIDPSQPDTSLLSRAAVMIRAGELVAYPTETFYGLAADPRNPQSVDRIFEAKGRPEKMALPLIAADRAAVLMCVSELSGTAERLAAAFWPGALTLVLPASRELPRRLLGGGVTVGVRISSHPIAAALARAVGGPIVATSANRSGRPAVTSAAEVAAELGDAVAMILDGGPTHGGQASTVLDLTREPPAVIRSGAVPLSALEAVLGRRLA